MQKIYPERLGFDNHRKIIFVSRIACTNCHARDLTNMQIEQFDLAVAGLYRAASGDEPWRSALTRVTLGFDGLATQFVAIDNKTSSLAFSETCELGNGEAGLEYVKTFHFVDPRVPLLLDRPPGNWLFCQDHFDESDSDHQAYYRDLLIPYGGRYSATMKVLQSPEETVLIALLSRIARGKFDADQKQYIDRMGIHLVQAITVFRKFHKLQSEAFVGASLIERIHKPIFVIGMDRAISAYNTAAAKLLNQSQSPVRIAENRLHATDADLENAITVEAVSLALNRNQQSQDKFIPIAGEKRSRWLAVSLSLVKPESTMQVFGAVERLLLTVHPRESNTTIDPGVLQAALSLTRAEARIAGLIFEGMSVPAAATAIGVATTTAKTHLSSVFNKTGVSKQTDLVRLIAGLFA